MKTVATTPIDLADFDTAAASDKGADIELVSPVGQKPLGVFFGVLGKDSQVFRDQVNETANSRIRQQAVANRRDKMPPVPTAEQAEARAIELLTLCTTHWYTLTPTLQADGKTPGEPTRTETILVGGETMTFSVANCLKVYQSQLWIRRQIDVAIGDMENFI